MRRTFGTFHNGKRPTVDIDLEDCIPSGARPSDRYPKPQTPPAPPASTVMVAGTKHTYDPASDSAPRGLTKLVIPVVSTLPDDDGTEEDAIVGIEEKDAAAGPIEDDDSDSGIAIPPALKRAMDHLARKGTPVNLDELSGASAPSGDAEASASPRSRSSRDSTNPAKQKRIPRRVTLRSRRRSGRETRAVALSRHERLCTICHHPEREAIEEAFLHWNNVHIIKYEFKLQCSDMAIYRHARALGLYQLRNRNLRSSLEYVIEKAQRISPTADGLVRAIRAYTRINENGEWIDTPTTHVVQVVAVPAVGRAKPALPALPAPKSSAPHPSSQRGTRKTPNRRRF
jgi:hypothetical protein